MLARHPPRTKKNFILLKNNFVVNSTLMLGIKTRNSAYSEKETLYVNVGFDWYDFRDK